MAKHALLSASGASRWLNCTPSARLEEKIADKSSEYAQEGSVAHEIAENIVRYNNQEFKKRAFNNRIKKIAEAYPQHYSKAMEEHCANYASIVWEKFQEAKKRTEDAVLMTEQRVDYSAYVPEGFGTADNIIIADGVLDVIDYKYGKGVEVSAEDNPQMKLYAVGALEEYSLLYDIDTVRMTIIQPRINNLSVYTISAADLLKWVTEEVVPKAQAAYKGEGDFCAGKHCTFCKIKPKCRAYAERQQEMAKYDFKQGPFLDETEISDILKKADEFKKWLSSVEEHALDQAVNHGANFPGMKLVEGRSNRKYTDQDQIIATLTEHGYEEALLYKPKEVLTITAMEKFLGKKEFNDYLSEHVIKPPGKPTLVSESDKRPEWNDAKKDFEEDLL